MSENKQVEITEAGNVNEKPADNKFKAEEWKKIADTICDLYHQRKSSSARKDKEKIWKEVDRQIAMVPDVAFKYDTSNNAIPGCEWLPELELPLQATALEVLVSDSQKAIFPDSGTWFKSHAMLTDEFMDKAEQETVLAGLDHAMPSIFNQDSADLLVQGFSEFLFSQYDFKGNIKQMLSECFRRGIAFGKYRLVNKRIIQDTPSGVYVKNMTVPVLIPRKVDNFYPDDSKHNLMSEGTFLGGGDIECYEMNIDDLKAAAKKGSSDPKSLNGGWMPANLGALQPENEKTRTVKILEYTGDIVIPKSSSGSIILQNVIINVAHGKSGKKSLNKVFRFRFNPVECSPIVKVNYFEEGVGELYCSSPLMKAMPIQKAAADSFMRMIAAGALNTQPPIRYDRTDQHFESTGGPLIAPGAMWATIGSVDAMEIGNPVAMQGVYMGLLQQYSDLTGINPARLGARTLSHTTRFAKEAELIQGQSRTKSFTDSMLSGALTHALNVNYQLGRLSLGDKEQHIYSDELSGFVNINKNTLAEDVVFTALGSGQIVEDNQKEQKRYAALQQAILLDDVKVQRGLGSPMDYEKVQKYVLQEGGFQNVEELFPPAAPQQLPPGAPPVGAVPGAAQAPDNSLAATLQGIAFGGG